MTEPAEGVRAFAGLAAVPRSTEPLTGKDFKSDQEVRWCPGCGDYAILAAFQNFLPLLGVPRENIVIVSGIGCSSRFPYYLETYGLHSIHGRAPAIATGLAITRPDVSVWVVTGDGDGLSIGGNHLIHALRRNVNIKILLFNNRVYGLTKGQYSPTSQPGQVTKSSPEGSLDYPFNPLSLAIGADATLVARTLDTDRGHLTETLQAAADHRGAAFVEIYQNCPVYNDGAFSQLTDADAGDDHLVRLEHGRPITFGRSAERALRRRPTGALEVVQTADVDPAEIAVHDARDPDPSPAFALARVGGHGAEHVPVGVFRQVERPAYDLELRQQVDAAGPRAGLADLTALLRSGDIWTVPAKRPRE